MQPHILLTYDFPPMGGGIARWMGELARRYPLGGLIVSTGQYPDSPDADDAFPNRIDRIPVSARRLRTLPGILQWSRRATMLAREHDASFLWCGNLKPAAYPAKWTRERLGTPFGVLLHGGDLLVLQHQIHHSVLKRRAARALLRSASVLVANSEYTRELALVVLRELGLESDGRVHVVPLGADPAFFRPDVDTAAVRERYDLRDGRWLLTVARLTTHKGVDTVLDALALMRRENPDGASDVGYAVVGMGERLDELRAHARRLGLADRVRFLTEVPDSDLPALYNVADVYVGVSRRAARGVEGFGISLTEASACGRPIVAGRSGGMPDAVRDGETGLLVDSERTEEVAAAVARILDDPDLAHRLGAAGRRAVERYFNWDRVVEDLRRIASETIAATAGAGPARRSSR